MGYLEEVEFPKLTRENVKLMDKEITEAEVREAIGLLATGKFPGPDGLPLEVYSRYVDLIAPILTKVYREAFARGELPHSMYEATVVLLLKTDKDPS